MQEPANAPCPAHGPDAELSKGTRVEVRDRFQGWWARGFEVAGTEEGRYRIRRLSDGSILPGLFARTEIRRERHRRAMWWY